MIIVVGVIVGGVLGSRRAKKKNKSTPTTTGQLNSSTTDNLELPPRFGFAANSQSGPFGHVGFWFADNKEYVWTAAYGRSPRIPELIFGGNVPPRAPLSWCDWSGKSGVITSMHPVLVLLNGGHIIDPG